MKFEDVYEEYKVYAEKRHKKQGFDTLYQRFETHVLPYFKNKNLEEITKLDIVCWQNKILEKKYSNNYNEALYNCFSGFYNYCVSMSYVLDNLILKVEKFPKKIESNKYDYYNLREFRKFRKNLDSYVYKQFFNMIFFYGSRPGETMAFRFCDLNGKELKLEHTLQRKGKRELDTPKNKSSVRTLNLNLIMRFRIWILKCWYLKVYGDFNENYFIFGGKIPLAPTTVDRYLTKACEKAKLRKITPHQFRHSYASNKIHKGVPIDIVSVNMGHSKVSTTVDIYLHAKRKNIEKNSMFRSKFFHALYQSFENFSQSIITFFM